MPTWKIPPKIKVYEALGSLADERVHLDGNTARVYSSSGNKYYTVTYDPKTSSIMCNDNGSYWHGYLGYPAICYLLVTGIIPYSVPITTLLQDIKWKDINTKLKNNWEETEKYVKELVVARGGSVEELQKEVDRIYSIISTNKYPLLGTKTKPPLGY